LNNSISDKDKKDWDNFITNKDKVENKDLQSIEAKHTQTRTIDLHGYTLEEANKIIQKFIVKAYSDKINKLIVITGKGLHSQNEKNPYVSKDLSILKYAVPEFIRNNIELMKIIYEIKDAEINDGGSGAFYIYLKK